MSGWGKHFFTYFLYRLWDILCLLYDVTYPTWIALCGINKVVKKKIITSPYITSGYPSQESFYME